LGRISEGYARKVGELSEEFE
jgi:hypothetical protein